MNKFLVAVVLLASIASLRCQDYRNRPELYPSHHFNKLPQRYQELCQSLKDRIRVLPDDTLKVNGLIELASMMIALKNDSALAISIQAQTLASKLGYKKGYYYALEKQAGYFGTQRKIQFEKSLALLKECATLAEEENWDHELHRTYSEMLNIHFYKGDFPAAMLLSTNALAYSESRNNQEKIASYKNLLGFIHLRQGNWLQSKKYYSQYLEHALQTKDSTMTMDAKIGLGEVLLYQGEPALALPVLNEPMHYFTDRLMKYGLKGMKTEKVPYSTFAVAKAHRDLGNYEKALELCLIGFSYSDSIAYNEYELANYYLITGSVYEKLNQLKKSIEVYRQGLKLSLRIQHAENIRDSYASLARVFATQKQIDSAFYYEKFYSAVKDSIVNVRTRSEIQRINAQYDIRRKDRELEQQQKMHEAELRQQAFLRNSILVGVLALVIIGWLIYNRYRLKEKHRMQVQLSSQRSELLNSFIHNQNTERNRIARDIHDQVGTLLSAAKLKLSEIEENLPGAEKSKITGTLETLDLAADSLRSISHNLVPASLSRLGLIVALEHFFSALQKNSSVTIQYAFYNFNGRLDENMEINLYPIVLELTNNVLKHASAKTLVVQLIRHTDRINITIEDDGKGFIYDKVKEKSAGLGLASVESRVEILNGNFHVDSVQGRGTITMIDVPV